MNKDVPPARTEIRSAAGDASGPALRKTAIGVVAGALMVLAGTAAFAQDFDVVSLKGGEVRHMVVWASNPFLRICNDMTSAGAVAVDAGRSGAESLQPGMCTTDEVVDKIVLANKSAGEAMVTYRSVNVDGPGAGG